MSFFEDIKKQPQHIREIMFGLCVITTVSLVGMVWFGSFKKDTYALLNPEDTKQERLLAQENQTSLFGNLSKTFKDIGATISNFWGSNSSDSGVEQGIEKTNTDRVYLLPLSEEK